LIHFYKRGGSQRWLRQTLRTLQQVQMKETLEMVEKGRQTGLLSATSAWTQPEMLWSPCVATCSAGPASTSGWRPGLTDKSVLSARQGSVKIRLYHSMGGETLMGRTQGKKCLQGHRDRGQSQPQAIHFQGLVLVGDSLEGSICLLELELSPLDSLPQISILEKKGPDPHRQDHIRQQRKPSSTKFSYGWHLPSSSGFLLPRDGGQEEEDWKSDWKLWNLCNELLCRHRKRFSYFCDEIIKIYDFSMDIQMSDINYVRREAMGYKYYLLGLVSNTHILPNIRVKIIRGLPY